ncbi:MAG: hypothetical protein U5L45_10960 [Saprospiraceae bacterium]|nr:hypothetical protein [Saprospiraceae bacterium]
MSNPAKSKLKKKLEYQATITKEPSKVMLAAWYDVDERTMRNRYKSFGVHIINRTLTESNYGEIFYKCGIPTKIPAELHEWAKSLAAAYFRLFPFTSVVF